MKKITLLSAITMIAFTANSFGQSSSTTGDASVTVIAPLTVEQQTALNFGTIAAYDAPGSLKITAEGAPTVDNLQIFGTANAAIFNVTGDNNQSYNVTLPGDEDVRLTDGLTEEAGQPMTVTDFVSDLDKTANGVKSFKVGATLNVNELQQAGTYTGSYNVIVQYN